MITGNEGVSIALIISVVSLACTIIATIGGGKKQQKDDIETEIERRAQIKEEFVKVNFKLDEFCRRLDELGKKYDVLEDHGSNNRSKNIWNKKYHLQHSATALAVKKQQRHTHTNCHRYGKEQQHPDDIIFDGNFKVLVLEKLDVVGKADKMLFGRKTVPVGKGGINGLNTRYKHNDHTYGKCGQQHEQICVFLEVIYHLENLLFAAQDIRAAHDLHEQALR